MNDLQYGYNVPFTQQCISRSDDEVVYETSIDGYCTSVKMYPDAVCSHLFEPGDTVYAVYAIWSTGDSFNQSICSGYAVYGLFKDQSVANELLTYLENYESPMVWPALAHTFTTSDEQTINMLDWHGYFDTLCTLEVTSLRFM